MSEFDEARRRRLLGRDNAETSAVDALALAAEWLREKGAGDDTRAVVVIEREEGGVVLFTARGTLSESVYLLESGKLTLMLGKYEER